MSELETGTVESTEQAVKDGPSLCKFWLDQISIADSDEKDWRQCAANATDLYRQSSADPKDHNSSRRFNILHSNIETITPALYNSVPVPDVRRRFSDADPVGKLAAQVLERCLSYSVDSYDFDHTMKLCTKDGELVGRGQARIRYTPYLKDEEVAYQEVKCEHVPWKHYRRGPAQKWEDLPWEAFELFLDKDQLDQLNPKLSANVKLDVTVDAKPEDKGDGRNINEVYKRARVWEIWDKTNRQVLFVSESYKDQPLKIVKDPFGLDNFFLTPRPIYAVETSDSLVPVVPYEIYKAQAEDLERVSQRIQLLTEAVKAKAVYDGRMTEMARLADAEDTDHIAVENLALFADGSKLNDHIWFYPIEVIVGALEKCYEAREQIKATIYEITGISDILRGQSVASETATAQNIKQQWGSLRIQDKQKEIQRFARDLFRLKSELFATKFDPKVLSIMVGFPIPPEVTQLLQSDRLRSYRVDIESDSTIKADLTRNQQNMNMFLQGSAQFIQGVGPLVQQYPEAMPAIMEVYSSFARNFKLGKQAEDALDGLAQLATQAAAKPKPPSPEMQAKMAEIQAEQQQSAAELQFKGAESQQKLAQDQQKHEQDMQFAREKHANEMALKQQEMQQQAHMHHQQMAQQHEQHAQTLAANAHEAEAGRDFERDKAGLPKREDLSTAYEAIQKQSEMLAKVVQNVEALGQAIQQTLADMGAPSQLIKDARGKTVAVKKGSRTMAVVHGPDGRPVGLH